MGSLGAMEEQKTHHHLGHHGQCSDDCKNNFRRLEKLLALCFVFSFVAIAVSVYCVFTTCQMRQHYKTEAEANGRDFYETLMKTKGGVAVTYEPEFGDVDDTLEGDRVRSFLRSRRDADDAGDNCQKLKEVQEELKKCKDSVKESTAEGDSVKDDDLTDKNPAGITEESDVDKNSRTKRRTKKTSWKDKATKCKKSLKRHKKKLTDCTDSLKKETELRDLKNENDNLKMEKRDVQAQLQRTKQNGQILAEFHHHGDKTYGRYGENEGIRGWSWANWVGRESRKLLTISKFQGATSVMVNRTGFYRIYSQLTFNDSQRPYNKYAVYVNTEPELECVAASGHHNSTGHADHHPHQTCYTSKVTRLNKGDQLWVKNIQGTRTISARSQETYFGVIHVAEDCDP